MFFNWNSFYIRFTVLKMEKIIITTLLLHLALADVINTGNCVGNVCNDYEGQYTRPNIALSEPNLIAPPCTCEIQPEVMDKFSVEYPTMTAPSICYGTPPPPSTQPPVISKPTICAVEQSAPKCICQPSTITPPVIQIPVVPAPAICKNVPAPPTTAPPCFEQPMDAYQAPIVIPKPKAPEPKDRVIADSCNQCNEENHLWEDENNGCHEQITTCQGDSNNRQNNFCEGTSNEVIPCQRNSNTCTGQNNLCEESSNACEEEVCDVTPCSGDSTICNDPNCLICNGNINTCQEDSNNCPHCPEPSTLVCSGEVSPCQIDPICSESSNLCEGGSNICQGKANQVQGEQNVLIGDYNDCTGDANCVTGDANCVIGDKNLLVGDTNACYGEVNTISGSLNKVTGDNNVVMGSGNTIMT